MFWQADDVLNATFEPSQCGQVSQGCVTDPKYLTSDHRVAGSSPAGYETSPRVDNLPNDAGSLRLRDARGVRGPP